MNTLTKGRAKIGALAGSQFLQYAEVTLTNAQVKALNATPITIVPTPTTGVMLQPVIGEAVLKAGANVLTETGANLQLKYTDGSGAAISELVEATGFLDQAVDTVNIIRAKLGDNILARTACENKAIVLTAAGAIAGNAAADATLRIRLWYVAVNLGS